MAAIPQTWHLPCRPSWDCTCCGRPWPCAPAKTDMAEEFSGNRVSLVLYLAAQMTDAVDDYLATRRPVPTDLYERFLGWDRACRGQQGEGTATPPGAVR